MLIPNIQKVRLGWTDKAQPKTNIMWEEIICLNSSISAFLEKSDSIPTILASFALAFLTILIPLGVATLADFYQKKRDQEIEFAILDLNVVLDSVFKIRCLPIYIVCIFLPIILWDYFSGLPSLLWLLIYFAGIGFLIGIILNLYKWAKGDAFGYRFSYLEKAKNHKNLKALWESVWQATNIGRDNELRFFKIFSSTIDKILADWKSDKIPILYGLLNDFDAFMDNRDIYSVLSPIEQEDSILLKILEWHFKFWQKEKIENQAGEIYLFDSLLISTFRKVEKRAMKGSSAFLFFRHLKMHLQNKCEEYLEYILGEFYHPFFENEDWNDRDYDLAFRAFPKEWKITKSNLENEENTIPLISFGWFKNFAFRRIMSQIILPDTKLDRISKELFPEVEPTTWTRILIFWCSMLNGMEYVIQVPQNFGPIGRMHVYFESDSLETDFGNHIKMEKEKAFELAIMLFPDVFSKELLQKYIDEIEILKQKYDVTSSEGKKLRAFWEIFNDMMESLNEKQHSN